MGWLSTSSKTNATSHCTKRRVHNVTTVIVKEIPEAIHFVDSFAFASPLALVKRDDGIIVVLSAIKWPSGDAHTVMDITMVPCG